MMTGVGSVSSGTSAGVQKQSTDAAKANLDYNAFLKLFIASMKNQDPTKPNDPAQSLAQLASFSNVEQSIKLNDKLDAILSSSNANLAATLIGKTLSNLDGSVSGAVESVDNSAGGLAATLKDGRQITLADGYRLEA